jgi:hypothetical protein
MRLLAGTATGIIYAERGDQVLKPWRADKLQVKFVCAHCNNGWMSQLENRVKPLVEALFNEKSVTLDSSDQTALAAWSVKNAMVFEALGLDRSWFFVETERKALREALRPAPRTSVWIAKCVDHGGVFCSASDLGGVAGVSVDQVKVYVTTMGFGPLAIQVLSGNLPDAIAPSTTITADLRPGPWNRVTLRIWPAQRESVVWPASVGLSGGLGLETLSKRWSPSSADIMGQVSPPSTGST